MDRPSAEPARLLGVFEPFAPAIDTLWTGLRVAKHPERPMRLGFTACHGGAGTTTVAACVAISLAIHGGQEVVWVETNGADPSLARWLGIPPAPGLEEIRRGLVPLEQALRPTEIPSLSLLLLGGTGTPRPKEELLSASLQGPRTAELWTLWERLSAPGRHIIVDAPPVSGHPGTIPILASLDGTILVLDARHTKRREAGHTVRTLAAAGVPLAGTILNRCVQDLPAWMVRNRP